MLFDITIGLLILWIILSIVYFINIRKKYSYFKDRSIPTPRWEFLFGHYRTLWSCESVSRQWEKWTKEFGPIYGLYEGTRPVYVVSDADFLEEVFVKQSHCFDARRLPFITRLAKGNQIHLFAAEGERWRRQRSVLSPSFSNAKLQLMFPLIKDSIDLLMEKISAKENENVNIYPFYKQLTMDVICRCAFGLDTDVQSNDQNPFLIQSAKFFNDNHEKLFIVRCGYLFPFLIPFLTVFLRFQFLCFILLRSLVPQWINQFEELPGFWIINQVKHSIDQRMAQQETNQRIDLLQLMINAMHTSSDQSQVDRSLFKRLHYDEVSSNVFLFMIAGYETTSTTLAYATYMLATHPHIQKTLREEIDQWMQADQTINWEIIDQIEYLDFFLREVLRMYPVAIQAISREAKFDTTVLGYPIQQNSVIQPDVFSLHYDEKLWGPEDPKVFLPERHQIKRHRMSLMTFGQGPRQCIGMRFALIELKLTLMELIRRYLIYPTDSTETYFQLRETLVIQPDALFIRLVRR